MLTLERGPLVRGELGRLMKGVLAALGDLVMFGDPGNREGVGGWR